MAARWPLATFFTLAFALTWILLPFARTSVPVGLLALLGPAAAALLTSALCGGEDLLALRVRTLAWRIPVRWYLVAIMVPVGTSLLRSGIERVAGAPGPLEFQPITLLSIIVFVLVAGEEIGWRGFALPRLLRFGPWTASTIVGVLWAFWHVPLFAMEGMPQYGTPFTSYVPYLIGLSIILTWLMQRTSGSVVIATLFHGAVNTFGVVNAGADASLRGWTNAASYAVVALGIGLWAWSRPDPARPAQAATPLAD